MKNRKIKIVFPLDVREKEIRNNLLDGQEHEIEIDNVRGFNVNNRLFYEVSGYDITRNCYIEILLTQDGYKTLRKVPLLDYEELSKYDINARILSLNEVDNLLESNGQYISSMPLTTIEKIIEKDKEKQSKNDNKAKIVVLYDEDGRKFITSEAAEYLGYPNPKTVNYLPIDNGMEVYEKYYISRSMGFRLLNQDEYFDIMSKYDITALNVRRVDVVEYNDEYYIRREVFEGNMFGLAHSFCDFSNFLNDTDLFDCVKINESQKKYIDDYYSVILHRPTKMKRTGDLLKVDPTPFFDEYNSDILDSSLKRLRGILDEKMPKKVDSTSNPRVKRVFVEIQNNQRDPEILKRRCERLKEHFTELLGDNIEIVLINEDLQRIGYENTKEDGLGETGIRK